MPVLDNDTQITELVDGLDHPEGIAWGLDGYVYAGGEGGQVYRINIERRELTQLADVGGFVAGMALDSSHNIYACDVGNHCVQKITPGGVVTRYSNGAPADIMKTPNYPAFDAEGNLYVSDSGDWKKDNGLIYRVRPGSECEVFTRELTTFPNGICLGPGGDHLYVVMSLNPPRVDRIKIESNGSAGAIETVVELPTSVPDGVAFDTSGNLYVSMYRPDRIYHLSPSGQLDVLADDFEGTLISAPTNIAFCGRDRGILLSTNLGRWHITRYDTDATGLPLHYPDIR